MSIVISQSLVLTPVGETNANNPIIGYHNLVTFANISASSEDPDFPATNLANPSTNLRWAAESANSDIYLTFDINAVDHVDYVGIARHNFGSDQISVSIEGMTEDEEPEVWHELVEEVLLPDDGPVIFRFEPQALASIRIKLQPGNDIPTAAVVYVGKLLALPRRIYVGHTPITYNRQSNVVTGRSISGNFLGRVVLGESLSTEVSMQNISPSFFRSNIHPFFEAAIRHPFFFNWRPHDYPHETGFVWLTDDPTMSNQRPNGMVEIGFKMQGIVA